MNAKFEVVHLVVSKPYSRIPSDIAWWGSIPAFRLGSIETLRWTDEPRFERKWPAG